MNTNFFTRASAYIIDAIIVLLLLNIITMPIKVDAHNSAKLEDLTKQVASGEITTKEYYEEYGDLYYDIQKDGAPINAISIILTIGYFVGFGYLNKGQTIGKKLFGIRVVNKTGKPATLKQIALRSLFIYSLFSAIINIILVFIIGRKSYYMTSTIFTMIDTILILVTVILILFREDKRGLHDIIASTKVIKEN